MFYTTERDNHIKAMGAACVHHIHNLSASARANLDDIYSFNTDREARNIVWQATAHCLEKYPLFLQQQMITEAVVVRMWYEPGASATTTTGMTTVHFR